MSTLDKKTDCITFRLKKEILDNLREEANHKGISPNLLLNQILTNYKKFISIAFDFGFLLLPTATLQRLMEKLTDEEIEEVAVAHVENDVKDILLYFRTEFTIYSFLDVLKSWLNVSNISYRHMVTGKLHSYVIQHNLGKKWSLYFATIIGHAVENLIQKPVRREILENSIGIYFEL